MANNPYVNKVVYGNQTVMDISDTDASPSEVLSGKKFYLGSGSPAIGTAIGGVPEEELRDTVGWTGKNLLHIPDNVVGGTASGTTLTINRNAYGEVTSIVSSGTASADRSLTLVELPYDDVKGKIVSGGIKQGAEIFCRIQDANGGYVAEVNARGTDVVIPDTYSSAKSVSFRIRITNGTNASGTFYPMLRHASISDSTFEPYHKSVEETLRDAEVINGKNKLNATIKTQTVEGITLTVNSDGSMVANGTSTGTAVFILCDYGKWLDAGKTYKMCGLYSGSSNTYKMDITTAFSPIASNYDVASFEPTFSVDNSADYRVRFVVYSGQTLNNLSIKPMICEASENSEFDGYYIPVKDSKMSYVDNGVLGAKNRLNFNIAKVKSYLTAGTWTGNTYVQSGLTLAFSVDENGYITKFVASGVPSTVINATLADISDLPYGTYRFVGTAQGWGVSSFFLGLKVGWTKFFTLDALTKVFTKDASNDWNGVYIQFKTTYDGQARTFVPQILLPSDPDDTYVPYAMTNKELTDSKMSYADNGVLGAKNLLDFYIYPSSKIGKLHSADYSITDTTYEISIPSSYSTNAGIWFANDYARSMLSAYSGVAGKFVCKIKGSTTGKVQIGCEDSAPTIDVTTDWQMFESATSDLSTIPSILVYAVQNTLTSGTIYIKDLMITLATDTDSTYQPYAMTNKELTDAISGTGNIKPTPSSSLTEEDVVGYVRLKENAPTNAETPSIFSIANWSNLKRIRVVCPAAMMTSAHTGVGTWDDDTESDWWTNESFKYLDPSYKQDILDPNGYDVDFDIKGHAADGEAMTLGGYRIDTTTGKACIKFANYLLDPANAKLVVDITFTRTDVG